MTIIAVIFSSTFVAYGFARFKFPFRDQLFLIMISTMMIPAQVTLIPTFVIFTKLGWVNTYLPFIVPLFFGGSAFNVFLLRQFFMTIPYELDDAAKIDGSGTDGGMCSHPRQPTGSRQMMRNKTVQTEKKIASCKID